MAARETWWTWSRCWRGSFRWPRSWTPFPRGDLHRCQGALFCQPHAAALRRQAAGLPVGQDKRGGLSRAAGAAYTEQDERVLRPASRWKSSWNCIRQPRARLVSRTSARFSIATNRSSDWSAFPATCNRPATRTRPTSGWRRWIAISGRISAPVTMEALTQVAGFPPPSWNGAASGSSIDAQADDPQGPPGTCAHLLDTGVTITRSPCGAATRPQRIHPAVQNTDRVYAQSVPRGDTQKEKARRDGS